MNGDECHSQQWPTVKDQPIILDESRRERSGYSVAAGPEISQCDKKKKLSQAA